MRFLANGPSIPDELLIARDEGRVVFFCGAGVSRARAGLSDFFGLAETVIQKLGVPADSPARRILHEAREIGKRTGVQGLISVDRIFGLLERDFLVHDIESAVVNSYRACMLFRQEQQTMPQHSGIIRVLKQLLITKEINILLCGKR